MVLCLANKKLENIFIVKKLAILKQNKIKPLKNFTLIKSNDPYPNNEDVISSDAINNAAVAGKLKNKQSSKDLD